MREKQKVLSILFLSILFCSLLTLPAGKSCKDIVIPSEATAGDYSLFLKVRDPSREGLQVLCRVPKGTQYTYHHPWTGKPWEFTVNHTFLGVATQGDTLPNIVKAGMVLTDAGLAFGDADTLSHWINPTKNAWDDFDWIRYACQTADNEDDAILLLTKEATDQLHATGVSENLFLVGPQKAVVIEADALRYTIKNISEVLVMSNYPKDLWRTQLIRSLPIASSFDAQKETWVRCGTAVRLGSVCGVRIKQITPSTITLTAAPAFLFNHNQQDTQVTLSVGEQTTIGPFRVELLEIEGNTAKISMCTSVYAWEQKLLEKIQPAIGTITIQDMIRWSRLHTVELDGLRPLCEDRYLYEAAMVYKIPKDHPDMLSSGWFAANHACSSIYVPVHICDDDFYDPYETGEAAAVSLEVLQKYGHGNITALCQGVETVFLFENEANEALALLMIHSGINITSFLTELDKNMQEQAFLTELLWLYAPNASQGIIGTLWEDNYEISLQRMQHLALTLKFFRGSESVVILIERIIESISASKNIYAALSIRDFLN